MPESEPDHRAPEGAFCAEHPERSAAFMCPRCGNYSCLFCWHQECTRCDACLRRDPTAAAPPIPWETRDRGLLQRYVATFASVLHPTKTAPAFAQNDVRPALFFFLLSALPLAAISGIIPNTKTLLFGGSFQIILQGKPTAQQIALDVLLAMIMQVGGFMLDMLALGLPYNSLVRAYAPERRAVALRTLFYRSWLVPLATLLFFVVLWVLPAPPGKGASADAAPVVVLLFWMQILLNVMLFISMRTTARLAAGITPVMSYVVVIVAFIVRWIVQFLVEAGARGLTPKG